MLENMKIKIIVVVSLILISTIGYSQKIYTLNVSVNQPQSLVVSIGHDTTICPMSEAQLKAVTINGNGGYSYQWSPSSGLTSETAAKTTASPSNNTKYFVTVTDAQHCTAIDTILISLFKPYRDTLGLVTFGDTSNRVVIAWQKTKGKRIEHYEVLREKETTGIYETVGNIAFNDSSYYFDSNPKVLNQSFRYKLRTFDSCGNYVDSKPHRTMVLQTSYNPAVDKGVNLTWNAYEGIDVKSYIIYRSNKKGTLDSITSIPGGDATLLYVDNNNTSIVKYRIGFKLDKAFDPAVLLKADSGPFSVSLSNMAESELVGQNIEQQDNVIIVSPNPTSSSVIISVPNQQAFSVEVFDVLGRIITTKSEESSSIIDCSTFGAGVYFVKIKVGHSVYEKRLVVE